MSVLKKQMYDVEFKIASVKLAKDSTQSVAQTARDLGVNENTLHGWVKKYGDPDEAAGAVTVSKETALYEELKQLRKENARLKQERDILKKAAAYFASEMA
jgi:transposase